MKSKRHQKILEKSNQPIPENIRIETVTVPDTTTITTIPSTNENSPENKFCKYHLPTRIAADLSFTGFLDDKDIFYKLIKNQSDISLYLNIIYNQAINYSNFIQNLQIDYNDIKELENIEPRILINYNFTNIMYKILFKYLNKLPIDERPIHFHNSLNNNYDLSSNAISESCNTNWYIRENDKWYKLDAQSCIPTIDMIIKDSTLFTTVLYDKVIRPLLIKCIHSWTLNRGDIKSDSELKKYCKFGIVLNRFLIYSEQNYLLNNISPNIPNIDAKSYTSDTL